MTISQDFGQLQAEHGWGFSMETALTKIVDDILRSIDGSSVSALMSLDISAALDAVNYNMLQSLL